ncbi:ribosome biogenesis GTPase Der [Caldichromatium japonicum]|uniref:GTPase Der n=1 Tax=Caldichromatium japonicum TaxID=2699430 RepID=A0A6G7VC39_9GAMM|nr:ribosome biogenesis GTPase Der [Caldichromatium japonicum]QIK37418.1 ribosome biogenesis GTPase Der [Caldichromatium japonicum]
MLPVIALIGRPNVGKSTLFNRLTRTRAALVADLPGLTRDRQYGIGRLGSRPYVVVDTGGIGTTPSGIETLMERQVQRAIDEADHLLFLVDARVGCTPEDLALAQRLRRLGKPLTLAVNKSDIGNPSILSADFHQLGLGEPWTISATQGMGVHDLIEQVLEHLPETVAGTDLSAADPERIRVAVVGRPNVGKSTLINRLLGEERLVTFDSPGTTRDSIFIPFERPGQEQRYTLIDTAGLRRRARIDDPIEKFSVIKTLQAIDQAHVVILVLDARAGIAEQDATLGSHILDSGRALIVAINKWDGLEPELRAQVRTQFERRLRFLDFAPVYRISALHGTGVGHLLDAVDLVYANANRDLSTPELNRLLESAVQEHPPPLVKGRRIKLRYAHQGGRNPPFIIIHGNQTEAVPETYQRYLINRFREGLDLFGTPLRIEFKTGQNPYEGKRNTLTPRQIAKKRRLKRLIQRRER